MKFWLLSNKLPSKNQELPRVLCYQEKLILDNHLNSIICYILYRRSTFLGWGAQGQPNTIPVYLGNLLLLIEIV